MRAVATGVCGVLVALLAGCSVAPARTALPDGFHPEGEGHVVEGRTVRSGRTPVRFGPYATVDVNGWSLPTRWTVGGRHLGFGKESARYGFTLEEAGVAGVAGAQAHCSVAQWLLQLRGTVDGDDVSVTTPVPPDAPVLYCDVGPSALTLWSRGSDIIGAYALAGGEVRIESLRALDGVPVRMGVPVGYRFARDGHDLMVVDLLAPGRVWFAQGLDAGTRRELAVAASALLMLPQG